MLKIRNKYNKNFEDQDGEDIDLDLTQQNISEENSKYNRAYADEINYIGKKSVAGRVPQGHPGMNMDSVISHRQFTGAKDNKFQNFNTQTNTGYSIFQIINVSLFGYSLSEYFFAFMICLVGYFYIFSKSFNDKYATAWFDSNKTYFDRFSRICVKPDSETIKNTTPMIKDAYNIYRYYVEEYKAIKWLTAILEFKVKQDTSSFVSGFLFTIQDKIYYRVGLNPVDPVPNVFCICKKTENQYVKKSYKDIVSVKFDIPI
jgi:hypothetical protein